MKRSYELLCSALALLVLSASQLHGQGVPPTGELPLELRGRLAPDLSSIDLVVPKSDTAGMVELYGAGDLAKLFTQPASLRLTNASTVAELLWRQPLGKQGFYRAQFRAGVTVADYLPKIIAQPQGTAVVEGATATLAVTSSALTGQSYQWQFNGNDLPGQTGPTMTLANFTEAAQGEYRVIVSSVAGAVRSEVATVTVQTAVPTAPEGMVWIPPGTFVMGSPESEPERDSNQETQHTVTLTQGFFMGRYEVTQEEYSAVMGLTNVFIGQNRPITGVDWNHATNYCFKLTASERKAGRLPDRWEYRLPTEAQWEYACRAGTTTATAFGNSLTGAQANFDGKWPYPNPSQKNDPAGIYKGKTTPVGSYAPNAWGLYDMHGNVWEWCADFYEHYPNGSVTDPTGPFRGSYRIIRGGGWSDNGLLCRSANRIYGLEAAVREHIGFRVVLVRVQ